MKKPSSSLYTPESVRRIDQIAIHDYGIPGFTLMRRAGKAVLDVLRQNYPQAKKILVLCGAGNNAGDGYVIARLAQQQGMDVRVVSLIDPETLQGDARQAYEQWNESAALSVNDVALIEDADVVVDALLGTGLTREVDGSWLNWIDAINYSDKAVISVDVPSGLDALTGSIKGAAICADMTVTFIALKVGLFTASGKACCGEVIFNSLDVPESVYETELPVAELLISPENYTLPKRRHDSHKGLYGHVLVIGGNDGMPGAVILTAKAALRSGAAMVTVVTRLEHVAAVAAVCPEAMVYGSENGDLPELCVEKISIAAIGPGLGRDTWAHRLLMQTVTLGLPMVMDADALNLVAENKLHIEVPHIITPHPGEAARLLSRESASEIQLDRIAAIKQLHDLMKGVVVLKGSGTMIYDGDHLAICPYGNPAMAVAGMGDVLTGVIAAFVAQGMNLNQAAIAGVSVHALAGDLAADGESRGVLASDVIDAIRQVMTNEC
ncbi:MAG: NAD(P)H-hydrate dehydratase [Gammaproteobacteria bacterium]|nr:NAD(P)H-hydrate dehydratase [Gammaproteobacteria bacterium]MCK5262310.1 NAD(P)H-hydrate dehydratase [Gammaproteobacteria bacterium]